MIKPVCLVIGAGAGIGGTVGKKFAAEGYHSVLCRRSDEEGLQKLVAEIQAEGGEATGYLLNAVDEGTLEERIAAVEAEIGPIQVVLFNLGAQIGNRSLEDTPLKTFELGWRMATLALFRVAKEVIPHMEQRGGGTILVTSATAAVRARNARRGRRTRSSRPWSGYVRRGVIRARCRLPRRGRGVRWR